jgi:hypothetical protein
MHRYGLLLLGMALAASGCAAAPLGFGLSAAIDEYLQQPGGGGMRTLQGDADTVDGFDAYSTPHANALLALNGSKHFPVSVIADNSIPGGKLVPGAVTAGRLGNNSVTTEKITDGQVTSDDLAAGAVVRTKIANGVVTTGKLAPGAVTAGRLADNSVTDTKIVDGAVHSEHISLPLNLSSDQSGSYIIRAHNASSSNSSRALYGYCSASSGWTYGVHGLVKSSVGKGVYGQALGTSGVNYGVYGRSDSPTGYGVYSDGDMYVDGDLIASGSKGGYVTDIVLNGGGEPLSPGDVVEIVWSTEPVVGDIPVPVVRKASSAGSTAVLGPIDGAIDLTPGEESEGSAPRFLAHRADGAIVPGGYAQVVTLGCYARIKVDARYGPIYPGDLLVSSPTPGYAMVSDDPGVGTVVGKALAALESGLGEIPVFVSPK